MRGLNPGGSASSRGEGVCHATILSTSGRCGIDYRRVPATILASANLHTITLHAKQRAISGSYGIADTAARRLRRDNNFDNIVTAGSV